MARQERQNTLNPEAVNPPPTNLVTPNSSLTGRHEYLFWINRSLKMEMKKIEEMCSGATYCQFMHVLFPDTISLKLVKWDATSEHQYIDNFKILQNCFSVLKVKKKVPIDKLSKGKFMDNYDFLMWFKVFYDANFQEWPLDYDPIDERNKSKLARPPSSNLSRTPDCSSSPGLEKLAPTRECRSSSPSTAVFIPQGSASINATKFKLRESELANSQLKEQVSQLFGQVMEKDKDIERLQYIISAVQEYCHSNGTDENQHLMAILAITKELPQMLSNESDYDENQTF